MRYEREVTQFIANETTLVLGTTLQHGMFTETSQTRCTAIIYNQVSIAYFDLPDRIDVMVEVESRDKSFETSRDDQEEIYNALFRRIDKAINVVTSGNELKIQTSECTVPPRYLGVDGNKRHHWSSVYLLRLKIVE